MNPTDNRAAVLDSFGKNAAAYATSQPHAKGGSLIRLIELLQPQAHWVMLDIATGAGHTALALAPHVAQVIASDFTPQMLAKAAELAGERGLDNLTTQHADAEDLPFEAASFDLVTCRIAPHHFPNPAKFVAEVARVLRPGGTFALVDNIVPADPLAGAHINAIEKRRDPSHVRCLTVDAWLAHSSNSGLKVVGHEIMPKRIPFKTWTRNQQVPAQEADQLRKMILSSPPAAREFLSPDDGADGFSFYLAELILVAKK